METVRVRAAMEQVDQEIGALAPPSPVLYGAWSRLVTALALGRRLKRRCSRRL